MKKTLITLLALAGVASAAQQTIDMTGYEYGDGFYLTTTLSAETVTSLIGTASLNKTILGHSVTGVQDYTNPETADATISYTAALGIKTWDDEMNSISSEIRKAEKMPHLALQVCRQFLVQITHGLVTTL